MNLRTINILYSSDSQTEVSVPKGGLDLLTGVGQFLAFKSLRTAVKEYVRPNKTNNRNGIQKFQTET